MTNYDNELLTSMDFYGKRLNRENWLCRLDLEKVMRSEQISNPREDRDPQVYKEFFKYAAKLAERFPDWEVMGYMMTTQCYTTDADGNVRHEFGRKTEDHPFIRAARLAPEEFKEFAVSALASARDHSGYDIGKLLKNKEAFGLKDEDIAFIFHRALEDREKGGKFGHNIDREDLSMEIFAGLLANGNENLLKDFMAKYPQDFEKMAKTCANYGYGVLWAMGDGEKRPVKPQIQEWIDENPKVYGDIVQKAINSHCMRCHKNEREAEFEGGLDMINKSFLAKNPDFVAKAKENMQGQYLSKIDRNDCNAKNR